MKIVLCVSGASGVSLGVMLYRELCKEADVSLVISDGAKKVFQYEIPHFSNDALDAPPSSGSYGADIVIVAPCSINTLSKIAHGISDTLTTRCAAVALKEGKKLILAPRESPLSPIALENMLKLSKLGVVIAPPMYAEYSDNNDLDGLKKFIVGRWLDMIGIKNNLYKRWGE